MIPPFLYDHLIRPLLFQIDPETIHHAVMQALRMLAPLPWHPTHDPKLARTVFGLRFPNPVGLAAGMDKEAEALHAWQTLGFGFVEAGTITAHAQPGNPRPRIFRLQDMGGLINRMGFNNSGAEAVAQRLERLKATGGWPTIPIGINLGKTKVTPLEEAPQDYLLSFNRLFALGDYFVLNVSSPNTPGLRTLQGKAELDELLGAVMAANRAKPAPKPLLLKIAPDLEWPQIDEILELVTSHGLAGLIATNTTLDHSCVPEGRDQTGGLSGKPLRARSTEIVRYVCKHLDLPVIAVGGIFDADAALEKLDAGAALVQLYTGFIYRGPALVNEICRALKTR
ncbi:MAG: quinone-dependent dihydroorotate dehydrogenase [Chthoniobacteraceae bacterium]|nr:quinone-dependent dihydroorotate dehydrogenase [Chthoniobacteraceae bacterium]